MVARSGDDGARSPARAVRNVRPRDRLGRPLAYGSDGVEPSAVVVDATPAGTLDEAQRLLDAGLPFHAHEVLEDRWKTAPVVERDLWRGLAQLAVGVTHAARGNTRGAVALLRRGAALIAPTAAGNQHGVDVAGLLAWTDRAVDEIGAGDPITAPPRLRSR